MTRLVTLLEQLRLAESTYKTAKSSLDGSNALIIAKEDLKSARFSWLKACEEHVLVNVFGPTIVEDVENEQQ